MLAWGDKQFGASTETTAVLPEILVTIGIPVACWWQRTLDSVNHTYVTSVTDTASLRIWGKNIRYRTTVGANRAG